MGLVKTPGLDPVRFALPCRYFFLQLRHGDGSNVTDSRDLLRLDVTLTGQVRDGGGGGGGCRVWTEVMNRNDGLFIVRYKLFLPCDGMSIAVRYGVIQSWFILKQKWIWIPSIGTYLPICWKYCCFKMSGTGTNNILLKSHCIARYRY
jgi:hypothetical protein